MKLLTLDPDVVTTLEWLGCDREAFPGSTRLHVVVGPPEIVLDIRRKPPTS